MMNEVTYIITVIGCYGSTLLLFGAANRNRPGIAAYNKLRASDLKLLSTVHFSAMLFLLLPTLLIQSPPLFLLQVPAAASNHKILMLQLFFTLLVLTPWGKWHSKEFASEQSVTLKEVCLYTLSRITYLIAYEWFFRGLLLTCLVRWMGGFWAVVVNLLLYMLAHFHKSRIEIIGCMPFGCLLCLITLWWQSIWPATVLHLTIAILAEWPPIWNFLSNKKQTTL